MNSALVANESVYDSRITWIQPSMIYKDTVLNLVLEINQKVVSKCIKPPSKWSVLIIGLWIVHSCFVAVKVFLNQHGFIWIVKKALLSAALPTFQARSFFPYRNSALLCALVLTLYPEMLCMYWGNWRIRNSLSLILIADYIVIKTLHHIAVLIILQHR